MYGMVNKAMEQMVKAHHGADVWTRIREAAGLQDVTFISSQGYDDKLTYDLVGAATAVLGQAVDRVLVAFGEYWVGVTGPQGYAALLDAAGASLPEFLENLPDFHARVLLILPDLRPPEFWLSARTGHSVVVHYRSHRPGLQPFVRGLLLGLGKRFGMSVAVTLQAGRADGLDHDEFLVRWGVPE